MLPRLQLFEFEDLPGFPRMLRDPMTDYLAFTAERFDLYREVPPLLERCLAHASVPRIVDLGSGGGGGWSTLAARLGERVPDLRVTLTDLHPNREALQAAAAALPHVEAELRPVDARRVPPELTGLRTQFLSLHHLTPTDATAVLADAVRAGEPIAVFEAQERTVQNLIGMLLVPVFVLVLTPFIRPVTLPRLLFTYLLPLLPLLILFDGVVSVLRCHMPDELMAMARAADPQGRFAWKAERLKAGPARVLAFTGVPTGRASA